MPDAAFDTYATADPARPVLLSIPHAGRAYPPIDKLRIPIEKVRALEDRYADLLATRAIAEGAPALIARTPRLWIDLNRAEDDFDPAMVAGRRPTMPPSAKVRGGLGLIPRRLGTTGELWRLPLDEIDVMRRIASTHRPYHAAVAETLEAVRNRFGAALLIDLHSMPTLPGDDPPAFVIGDRFGTSSALRYASAAEAALGATGLRVVFNAPYAGGYIAKRHACPAAGIHVLQIEVDRARYLDGLHDRPGAGLAAMQSLIAHLTDSLCNELLEASTLAAE